MLVKELMSYLSKFPENYDVQIPVVPEGYMSPYLLIFDGGRHKRQIWVTAMGHASDNPDYSMIKVDERGNFVRDYPFDDERFCPGAYNGDFNE